MKKIVFLIVLISILFVTVMASCETTENQVQESKINGDIPEAITDNETDITEKTPESSSESIETNINERVSNVNSKSEFDVFLNYYPQEMSDLFLVSKIKPETIDMLDNEESENAQLPKVYRAICNLKISKEDFISENNYWKRFNNVWSSTFSTYSDDQIEAFFSNFDESRIKNELKADSTFFYEGKLYNIYEITSADITSLLEMAEKSNLTEYLNNVIMLISEKYPSKYDLIEKTEKALKLIFDSQMSKIDICCPDYYHRYYQEKLYDVYMLTKIRSWSEITAYASDIYNMQSEFERNRLPVMYQFIKGLSVNERDFISANNYFKVLNQKQGTSYSEYSDEEIRLLFDDSSNNSINRLIYYLKADTVISCDSVPYNIFDIFATDKDTLRELNKKCKLVEYLSLMKAELKKQWGSDELIEKIDFVLKNLRQIEKETIKNTDFHLAQYELYYPVELNNSSIFYEITDSKTIDEFILGVYEKQSFFERKQFPLVYKAILGLSVSKDEFVAANEKLKVKNSLAFTEEQIEILFGNPDGNLIKQKLKADTAFYYNGILFNIRDLEAADSAVLTEMADNGGLIEYLNKMMEYLSDEDIVEPLIIVENIMEKLLCDTIDQFDSQNVLLNYYPKELYSISMLFTIRSWEDINLFATNDYQKISKEKKDQLPPLYHYICGLSIGKEELISANEYRKNIFKNRDDNFFPVLADDQIEVLFDSSTEKEIKEGLKSEYSYYHDGRLLNVYDIASMDLEKLNELKQEKGFNEFHKRMMLIIAGSILE